MKKISLKCALSIAMACLLLTACDSHNKQKDVESDKESAVISEQNSKEQNVHVEDPEPKVVEVDFSPYFGNYNGSAVFYSTSNETYEIYNMADAQGQRSPCSTFKIFSTLAALEYGIITADDSLRAWSGEQFWKADWNADMTLEEAFKTSCIWYYRELINEIGQEKMQIFIDELKYGNQDISDWEGKLNQNNNNRAETGFWVESSLLVSPLEQVDALNKVFGDETNYNPQSVQTLKNIMKVEQDKTDISIYGKTGYGKFENISLNSWFVGMFEINNEPTYFAIHLSETEDPNVTSALAKEIALQIIADHYAK